VVLMYVNNKVIDLMLIVWPSYEQKCYLNLEIQQIIISKLLWNSTGL